MNPRPRHAFLLLSAAVLAASAVALWLLARASRASLTPIPPPPSADLQDATPAPPPPPASADAWAAIVPDEAAGRAIARRFRLAGTLLGAHGGAADIPLAVLDDRSVARQRLVRLGEEVADGIRLVEVRHGEAVLEGPAGRATLRVERRAALASAFGDAPGSDDANRADAQPSDRFGGREVFPGRWEFSRDRLLDYYTELRREPERLVAVFDSLEPLWKDGDPTTRVIEGYQLNVQGEADFFQAMGMRQGDIVRSVNSVDMTNRIRAEAFIEAFVLGDLDTFVIDMERDGEAMQHVYVTR